MLRTAKKKIGNTTYEYTCQKLTPATELLSLCVKHIGEPLVTVLAAGADTDVGKAAAAVVAKIGDPAIVLDLVRRVNAGGKATIKGSDGKDTVVILSDENVAEAFFGDRPDEVLPWLAFALETQLGPFVASVPKLLGLDPEKTTKMIEAMRTLVSRLGSRGASSNAQRSSDSQAMPGGTTG